MKKIALVVALLGVVAFTTQVWAGGSCCPMSKKKADSATYDKNCSSALSGIDLTAEQKEKITKIEEECKAQGSTKEACEKSMTQIRDVLDDAQKAKFDAASSKTGAKDGCGS